ncbi:MAG: flagellar basal body L-ring protein FlgH [Planctomycetaceae bacterium]|jgi:flagellar basal body L-ring protein FlgH|nr:flagellar basal body L-ring protein FlgH [Planctomycetaceae bacterium]
MTHKIIVSSTLFTLLFTASVFAQSGTVNGTPAMLTTGGRPVKMTEASLTFQAPPRQRVFEKGDIIYVHIKDKRLYSNSANNQRKKKIETETKITAMSKFAGFFHLPVAMAGGGLPEIGGKIDHKTQNEGRLIRDETVDFYLPCYVTDIRDNGNLVIEGTRTFNIGEEGSITTISGIVRPDTIGPDFKVESNQVAELDIQNRPSGNVYDTVRRSWGARLVEQLKPF